MPRNNPNLIGKIAEPQKSQDLSLGREGEPAFKVGSRVTVKSIPATAIVCFRPTKLELAAYPNLVGVELTIESIDEPWIICVRDNGSRTLLQDEDGDRFYKCQTCGRSVPWCFGAADAMPDSCDDCWFATVFQEASDNEEATINV